MILQNFEKLITWNWFAKLHINNDLFVCYFINFCFCKLHFQYAKGFFLHGNSEILLTWIWIAKLHSYKCFNYSTMILTFAFLQTSLSLRNKFFTHWDEHFLVYSQYKTLVSVSLPSLRARNVIEWLTKCLMKKLEISSLTPLNTVISHIYTLALPW